MKVIGLTGGIGAGKSAVAVVLQELGAEIIKADEVGHQLYRKGTETWRTVVDAFGEGILRQDGEIDRKRLGAIVFNDSMARARLDAIMHPRMAQAMGHRLEELRRQGALVAVVEAAILVEAGWDHLVDEVWVVRAPQEAVLQRLEESKGLTEKEVRQRMSPQWAWRDGKRKAAVIIDNDGGLAHLRAKVTALWQERLTGDEKA